MTAMVDSMRARHSSSSATRAARSLFMDRTLRRGCDRRWSTSVIAVCAIGISLTLSSCGGERSVGDARDWEGLAAYVNANTTTDTTTSASDAKSRTSETEWCDTTSDGFYIAQLVDDGQSGSEAFSFIYFICGEDYTRTLIDAMRGTLSATVIVSAEQAFPRWENYAVGASS